MTSELVRHAVGFGPGPFPVYYERIDPSNPTGLPPVVMIHGGGHTGSCFQRTADGRPGWTYRFVQHGFPAIALDWAGHGRSGAVPVERLNGQLVCDSIARMIESINEPVVLLTHSMGGALGWRVLELRAQQIVAVVGVAPGPPGNIQPIPVLESEEEHSVVIRTDFGPRAILRTGFTAMNRERAIEKLIGASDRFPMGSIDHYLSTLNAYGAQMVYERSNVRGSQVRVEEPSCLKGKRVLVVTGTDDRDHSREIDAEIVEWVRSHEGVAEHLWLGDYGIVGNGHMLMMEDNADEIADAIVGWLGGLVNRS